MSEPVQLYAAGGNVARRSVRQMLADNLAELEANGPQEQPLRGVLVLAYRNGGAYFLEVDGAGVELDQALGLLDLAKLRLMDSAAEGE